MHTIISKNKQKYTDPNISRRRKSSLIFFTWAGWSLDFFDLILYSFLLVAIQTEFDLSNAQVALVYSASLAITAVGGIILGFVGDKFGRKPAIIVSVLIFTIGTLLSGIASGLFSLLIFRLITGFGIGGEWSAGHTLINESLPAGERARASAIIQSGAPVGFALAALVGGFITPIIGWRNSFFLAAVPSLILIIAMYFWLEESPQYLIFKAESQDIQSEQDLYIPRGVGYIREVTNRAVGNLKTIRRELGLGSMLSLFGMIAYWIVFSWAPKFLGELGLSPHQIGYWMLISQAGAFIGYISFGFIADYTGRIKVTFASYALVFAVGIIIFTSSTGGHDTSILPLIGIFITGLGTGFFSGYGPIYSKLFPIKVRNTSASFCFNSGRLGAFVAPILVAQLAVYFGFAFAMSLASIFAIILAGWVFLIPISEWSETKYKRRKEVKPIAIKIK